jgi:hypothetical protein
MSGSSENRQEMTWQEAIACLARERTAAETCAALLKKRGDAAAIDRGALEYGEAKAEYDGIIKGLTVALAQKAAPASLPDMEVRLQRGFAKRDSFCRMVQALVPPPHAGEKGWIEEAVKGAIGPLVNAIQAIWLRSRDDNAQMRKTIETQLEATAWPEFASIKPGP